MRKLRDIYRQSKERRPKECPPHEWEIKQAKNYFADDFAFFLQDNPPIEGGFSGDIQEILKIPKQQRAEALPAFKEKLLRQRKAMAKCRLYIERSIETDNDTPKQHLMSIVDQFSDHYAFSQKHRETAEYMIDRYYAMRSNALAMHDRRLEEMNTGEHAEYLLSELTGIDDVNTQLILSKVNGMSIDFKTDPDTVDHIFKNSADGEGCTTIAFASIYDHQNPDVSVYYTVRRLLFNAPKDEGVLDYDRKVLDHEHAHHKHMLFNDGFSYYFEKEVYENLFGAHYTAESLVADYKKLDVSESEPLFRKQQLFFLNQVKDEVIAQLHNRTLHEVGDIIVRFSSDDDVYHFPERMVTYLQKTLPNDSVFQDFVQKYFIDGYKKNIADAFQSLYSLSLTLVKIGGPGVTLGAMTQTAVALLQDVPLHRWATTVNRLLKDLFPEELRSSE